jgi:hypothetical protein
MDGVDVIPAIFFGDSDFSVLDRDDQRRVFWDKALTDMSLSDATEAVIVVGEAL